MNCPIAKRKGIISESPSFQKTVIALPVKDNVIEKLNANNFSGLFDLFGGIYV